MSVASLRAVDLLTRQGLSTFWGSTTTAQRMIAVGGGADMLLNGEENGTFDTILNLAGIATLFAPICPPLAALVLPVAMGYMLKAGGYGLGAIGSLFKLDFGGFFKNLLACAFTAFCALPITKLGRVAKIIGNARKTGAFTARHTDLLLRAVYGKDIALRVSNATQAYRGGSSISNVAKTYFSTPTATNNVGNALNYVI